jgi:hypothetical protein
MRLVRRGGSNHSIMEALDMRRRGTKLVIQWLERIRATDGRHQLAQGISE